MRYIAKTPRGFVRLRKVNGSPGNLGFTIPVALSRRMEAAGLHEGDVYRPVLFPDDGVVTFIKVEEKESRKSARR